MSDFLRRWSDRKVEAQQEATQPAPEPEPQAPAVDTAPDAAPDGALAPEDLAARLAELPAIDAIEANTDIRPFLQDFVPAALRKAALRRAWLADPVISTHLDVARDYAWDFNLGDGTGGLYSNLAREVAQRSLAALDGATRIDPENTAEQAASPAPQDPVPTSPEAAPVPDLPEAANESDGSNPAQVTENAVSPLLKHTFKHGGALPD